MAYEKTVWKNNEAPKINATNLNKMENGIANAVATDSIARVNNVVSKNKININGYVALQYSTRISVKNNTARVTCLSNGQNMYSCIKIENINELLGKTCTFKVTATSSSSNVPMARIYFGTDNVPATESANFDLYGETSNTQITSTFPANMPSGCDGAYVLLYGNRNGTGFSAGAYADFTDIQLEEGSAATDYAPYLNLEEAMKPKGVTLFDGATDGNVVLSDTPSNYNTLDIYYNVGSTILVQTVKANSAYFVLTLSEMDAKVSGNMGIINHYKNYIVNDKTFVVNAAGRLFKYQNDTNVTQDTIDYLLIVKVIGYK